VIPNSRRESVDRPRCVGLSSSVRHLIVLNGLQEMPHIVLAIKASSIFEAWRSSYSIWRTKFVRTRYLFNSQLILAYETLRSFSATAELLFLSILAPCTLVAICQPEFITRIYGWIWN